MGKAPTYEDIQEWLRLYQEKALQFDYSIESNTKIRSMTLRVFKVPMDENTRELAWKYCKKLTTFSHCPLNKKYYLRMNTFAQEQALVDVVLEALKGYYKPEDNGTDFDTIGYYYSIAMISQSSYRRNDCLAMLENITNYEISNLSDKGTLMLRNMQCLVGDYPDLKPFLDQLTAAQE